jgi:hypothetical protein
MKYIFILYVFDITDIDIFWHITDQTLQGLTLTPNYRYHDLERSEYYFIYKELT